MSERGIWIDGGRLLLRASPARTRCSSASRASTPLFADDVSGAEPDRGGVRPGCARPPPSCPPRKPRSRAYAGSLLAWHRRHRFCANCGAPTESRDGGHERNCPACDAHHFPRTDPVVIVRVTDAQDRLLLGRQARWPEGRFSLLAGFVEPGETLEEAVRREVMEESGVEVAEVAYVASQPWPFPSSLMLGFRRSPGRELPRPATTSSRRSAGSSARRWSGPPPARASCAVAARTRSPGG